MLNGFLLNPAIAGSEGYTAVNMTAREQWIGFDDAPGTYALSFQTRMLRKSYISKGSSVRKRQKYSSRSGKIGVGGYIYSDRNGSFERTGIKTSYAYHLFFGNSQLSLGMSLSLLQFRVDDGEIILKEEGDLLWLNSRGTAFIPDADFGIYYDTPDFYVGFSAEQLMESSWKLGDSGYDTYTMERTYYVMGGYDIGISDMLLLTPSALLKYAESGPFQLDLSAKLYYDQTYWAGLTYRTGSLSSGDANATHTAILMAGLSIDKMIFGYAYDISLSSIMKHSYGTHEFVFATKFGNSARRYRWLNRY